MPKIIKKTVKSTKQPSPISPVRKAALQTPSNYTKNGKRMMSPMVDNVADAEGYDWSMSASRNIMGIGKRLKRK